MRVGCSVLPVLATVLTALRPVAAATTAPKWFTQSWLFSWDPQGAPFPVPITAQCETIHITWARQTATGPDGIAPYYLQIYTSNFIFPFIIPVAGTSAQADVTIPFAPGTLYQICMFDSKGSTGGCQDVYTVYQNSTSTPTCANLTMPAEDNVLKVNTQSTQGALSEFGWIDSCTDLSVTPETGTPPFTFTVAPALHPPLNITSPDMSAINWTVSLSWASSFFISLVDSTGKTWSNGPIHSGDGKTACLSADSPSNTSRVSVPVTVGAAVGGLVLGVLMSLLAAFVISKRRKGSKRHDPSPFYSGDSSSQIGEANMTRYSSVPSQSPPLAALEVQPFSYQPQQVSSSSKQRPRPSHPSSSGSIPREYQVEPFRREPSRPSLLQSATDGGDDTTIQPPPESWAGGDDAHARATHASPTSPSRPGHQEGNSQVYVIHHDSGRAPVSVITSRGTEVVELPPGYSADYLRAGGSTAGQSSASDTSQRRSGKSPTSDVQNR